MKTKTIASLGIIAPIVLYMMIKDIHVWDAENQPVSYLTLVLVLIPPLALSFTTNSVIAGFVGDQGNHLGKRGLGFAGWLILNAVSIVMIFDVLRKIIPSMY